MSFAASWMLWWGLLAIPVVVLYVLKVRVRRVPVSTLMFWERVYEEKAPRSLWERLRHLSSLLLQLALLALLVIALADPVFDWEAKNARRVVLVVDNSASMQANDVAPSRLDAAKRKAAELLNGLRPRDEMAVLSAGTRPAVVVGMTGHVRTLRDAVESIPATDGPTRVAEAIEMARRLIADRENGQIVVLTDAAFDQAESTFGEANVVWLPVGGKAANTGITQFQVRRSLIDPIGYELLVEVTNSGNDEVESRLDLELGGEVIDAIPLKLSAGEIWRETFEKASAMGGELVATLAVQEKNTKHTSTATSDALAIDNVARALLPPREPRPVALVSKGNLFLEGAFQASPLVDLSVVDQMPKERPADGLAVFHKDVPKELPTGSVLVIDPRGSTNLWQLGPEIENPVVAKQAQDSPLLAHVRLSDLLLPQAHKILPTPGVKHEVLAQTADGDPLLLSFRTPDRKVLVLTADLDHGELPLRTAFPILLTNALNWYGGGAGELREAYPTGAIATVQVDERRRYTLHAPDGSSKALPQNGESVTIGPLDQTGVWRIVPSDEASSKTAPATEDAATWPEGTQAIACNLADRQESDVSPRPAESPKWQLATAGWAGRPMWFYLLIAVSLFIPAEWLLYQRRWIQ